MIQKLKDFLFVVAMLFVHYHHLVVYTFKISNASAVVINAPQEEIFAAINTNFKSDRGGLEPAVAKSPIKITQAIKYSVSFTSFTFKNDDTENQLEHYALSRNSLGTRCNGDLLQNLNGIPGKISWFVS
ncbi:MAG: hypothetical protein IPP11_07395 [Chitinophagaceae bacterium]|nr:hypothetical protein [Chitinophagaceae bacterium]